MVEKEDGAGAEPVLYPSEMSVVKKREGERGDEGMSRDEIRSMAYFKVLDLDSKVIHHWHGRPYSLFLTFIPRLVNLFMTP